MEIAPGRGGEERKRDEKSPSGKPRRERKGASATRSNL